LIINVSGFWWSETTQGEEMKTYKVDKNSEYVKDMGSYYLLTRNDWDGNLEIDLDKLCIVEGNQDVSGNQVVRGNQVVMGYQDVSGNQVVMGYQDVSGNQVVRGYQVVMGYQDVSGNQVVMGYQDVSGNQDVMGYQKRTCIVKAFNCKWYYYIKIDTLKIGCKEMTWKEWDKWFKGKEVFTTQRDTKDFDVIENGYQCAKIMREQLVIEKKYCKD
jgi:hypothetical protein